jgi:hypothetical protein
MSPYDDEDDWVGTPPEGHYSRDRADPEFWRNQRFLSVAGATTVILVIVVVLVLVLR